MKDVKKDVKDEYPYNKEEKDTQKGTKDWVITYEDGKKEPFRGFADEAFEHASSKADMFAVEVAGEDDPTVDDGEQAEELKPAK